MKILNLFICFTLITSAISANGKDPVFPWPLSSVIQPLDKSSLQGAWVAYERNTIWFIGLNPLDESLNSVSIHLRSNGIRTHQAIGSADSIEKVFLGSIISNDDRTYKVMLYRKSEGLTLRISPTPYNYYDLRLYRVD